MKKCCSLSPGGCPDLGSLGPRALIEARVAAFGRGDFGLIYDSYHPDAPFLQHFPQRADYLAYGRHTLTTDFVIHRCTVLDVSLEPQSARVLFYLDTSFQGQREETVELCILLSTTAGWCYHSGLKRPRQQFPGDLLAITMADFDKEDEQLRI